MSADTRVTCAAVDGGWTCDVATDAGTSHTVLVQGTTLDELAPDATPESLVAASFAFLLEREPATSILSRFELREIARYFPEFPDEIRGRLD